jgi:hypothetical protein
LNLFGIGSQRRQMRMTLAFKQQLTKMVHYHGRRLRRHHGHRQDFLVEE